LRVSVFYIGSSLLAPLRQAESGLNRQYGLDLRLATHNFGASLTENDWRTVEGDLAESDVVFVIHIMDGENASRLLPLLNRFRSRHRAVVVINCMPELMRQTRLGKLNVERLAGFASRKGAKAQSGKRKEETAAAGKSRKATELFRSVSSWIGNQARSHAAKNGHGRGRYLKLVDRLPALLRFVPNAGALRDVKNYLTLFCYFLQPTPTNIRSMVLYALKHYVPDERLKKVKVERPEAMLSVAIYHPDAPALFESFEAYQKWYLRRGPRSKVQTPKSGSQFLEIQGERLDPISTLGLLLMRPQIVSNTRRHYDGLIRAIEDEGLSVIPAISTLMDNREACEKFFLKSKVEEPEKREAVDRDRSRVSEIVSLTGFSFVGGPAMNDSKAAAEFLSELKIPLRSLVSLDAQTMESWRDSPTGLNPVQTGMQVAIPEIDGATEPFVFGGIPERGVEPAPLEDRCRRIARRLRRWNRLQTADRDQLKVALVLYCFPPNRGNIGTAADLDVFPSLLDILRGLERDGYRVTIPESADRLREILLGGDSESFGATANIAHRMSVDEYLKLCPFADEIENEWGPAPGRINTFGGELLIQGITLGNVFIGVQPTFGFEGDPMRLLMAKGGSPHHGFAAFYTYLQDVFRADAVVHVGTHGAMEFMPGKQVGLSGECWPDRLISELPNLYIYSVNNPSEGTIAKRRSYAELISYLTPPIENAGLYKGLTTLKDLVMAYRQAKDEPERQRLFDLIEEGSRDLHFSVEGAATDGFPVLRANGS
jgi:magnesium chelatase subunit H